MDFVDGEGDMFFIGNLVDELMVFEFGMLKVIMINVGIFIIFVNVVDIGYIGIEFQDVINNDIEVLVCFELLCVYGVIKMGLINDLFEVVGWQYMLKIVFVVLLVFYIFLSGKVIGIDDIDVLVRVLLMGKFYYVMMGMVVVVIVIVVVIFGILVNDVVGGIDCENVVFGYLFGILVVGV